MSTTGRLAELLAEAITRDRAAKGNIQVFDPTSNTLQIVVHQGFDEAFLKHFKSVKPFDASACGRAFGAGRCIMIPDVLRDEAFAPHREIALANGFRSVKSLPIDGPDGRLLGVLSTHSPDVRWDWELDNTRQVAVEIAPPGLQRRILASRVRNRNAEAHLAKAQIPLGRNEIRVLVEDAADDGDLMHAHHL